MLMPGQADCAKCPDVRQQLVGAGPDRTGGCTCTHVGRSTEKATLSGFLCCVGQVRQQLKADNYKAGRISQLVKATRPNPEQQMTAPDEARLKAAATKRESVRFGRDLLGNSVRKKAR